MRKYYARFFVEVRRRMLIFWKAQIAVSLGAGVIAGAVNAIKQQTHIEVAFWSIGISIVGYLAILFGFSIWAAMCAPVDLDNARQAEISDAESARRESDDKVHKLSAENSDLRKPHRPVAQQIIFDQAKAELTALGSPERQFVRTLLHREKIEHHALLRQLGRDGLTNAEWSEAIEQFREHSTLVESIAPTPLDQHNYWRVNPHFRDALIELLSNE